MSRCLETADQWCPKRDPLWRFRSGGHQQAPATYVRGVGVKHRHPDYLQTFFKLTPYGR